MHAIVFVHLVHVTGKHFVNCVYVFACVYSVLTTCVNYQLYTFTLYSMHNMSCAWFTLDVFTQVLYWNMVGHFPEELEKVVEVMEERELRIRAPLEEVQMLLDASSDQQ